MIIGEKETLGEAAFVGVFVGVEGCEFLVRFWTLYAFEMSSNKPIITSAFPCITSSADHKNLSFIPFTLKKKTQPFPHFFIS